MKSPAWLPRARDIAVMALALLEGLADLYTDGVDKHDLPMAALQGSLALVGTVALWWRRSRTERVIVLTMLLAVVGQVSVPLAMMLFALAVKRRDRVMWGLTALGGAAYLTQTAIENHGDLTFTDVLVNVLWVLVLVLFGAYFGARHDRLVGLQERAERAEAEQEVRAEAARLAERTRIAREMHDVLAHRISLIALHAGGLEITERPEPAAARQTAGLIRETARSALEDLRDVLGVLASGDTSAPLAPQPRFADIAELVERSAAAGVSVRLVPNSSLSLDAPVPEAVGRAAYRVVQEALTNIHKHAASAATTVRLSGAPDIGLEVRVENQAPRVVGTSLPGAGSGLAGLRERVEVAGGSFEAGPTLRGGFLVLAWLPWPQADAKKDEADYGVIVSPGSRERGTGPSAGTACVTDDEKDRAGRTADPDAPRLIPSPEPAA
ncbi:sensor histidine kinase [Catenulispora rubra]|uniref:sensor histidine kinase n=1 Tax=Catenulispora rubra TaxID=280293 RepID=UPI002B26AC0B|nr:histidine kinase [Catenulispora rubra]